VYAQEMRTNTPDCIWLIVVHGRANRMRSRKTRKNRALDTKQPRSLSRYEKNVEIIAGMGKLRTTLGQMTEM
jgi:hypothetical protein